MRRNRPPFPTGFTPPDSQHRATCSADPMQCPNEPRHTAAKSVSVPLCLCGEKMRYYTKHTPLGLPTVRRFDLRALRGFVVEKTVPPSSTGGARNATVYHHEGTKCTKFAMSDWYGVRTTASPVARPRPIQPASAIRWSSDESLLRRQNR